MRAAVVKYLLIASALAALPAAAQVPPATAPAPTPVTPAAPAAGDYGSFDAGTRISFYAEQNVYNAFDANPADANLLPARFVAGDFGGDLSFGGFSYTRNDGSSSPGPTHPGEDAGLDFSYSAGLGGRALGAYRYEFFTAGGALELDRTAAAFSYNGASLTMEPFFAAGDGWTDVDVVSQRYGVSAFGAADFKPHVAGLSFAFRPERVEGNYDFEYLPEELGDASHRIDNVWGRREIKDYHVKAGYSFRPGGDYDLGGAVGYRALRSGVDWRDTQLEEVAPEYSEERHTGAVKMAVDGFTVDGNGRYLVMGKIRLGGSLFMQFLPDVKLDWRGEDWDVVGPFGQRTAEDYRLAKCDERRYRLGGGAAVYPDEKTTLAFDYGFDLYRVSADVYDDGGAVVDELRFSAYHTFTQIGAERWLADNFAARGGWRQDLFGLPRNVFFGGLSYKFNDAWFINYDYVGDQLTANNLSLFVPFDDIVKPASHRFTVVRYF